MKLHSAGFIFKHDEHGTVSAVLVPGCPHRKWVIRKKEKQITILETDANVHVSETYAMHIIEQNLNTLL